MNDKGRTQGLGDDASHLEELLRLGDWADPGDGRVPLEHYLDRPSPRRVGADSTRERRWSAAVAVAAVVLGVVGVAGVLSDSVRDRQVAGRGVDGDGSQDAATGLLPPQLYGSVVSVQVDDRSPRALQIRLALVNEGDRGIRVPGCLRLVMRIGVRQSLSSGTIEGASCVDRQFTEQGQRSRVLAPGEELAAEFTERAFTEVELRRSVLSYRLDGFDLVAGLIELGEGAGWVTAASSSLELSGPPSVDEDRLTVPLVRRNLTETLLPDSACDWRILMLAPNQVDAVRQDCSESESVPAFESRDASIDVTRERGTWPDNVLVRLQKNGTAMRMPVARDETGLEECRVLDLRSLNGLDLTVAGDVDACVVNADDVEVESNGFSGRRDLARPDIRGSEPGVDEVRRAVLTPGGRPVPLAVESSYGCGSDDNLAPPIYVLYDGRRVRRQGSNVIEGCDPTFRGFYDYVDLRIGVGGLSMPPEPMLVVSGDSTLTAVQVGVARIDDGRLKAAVSVRNISGGKITLGGTCGTFFAAQQGETVVTGYNPACRGPARILLPGDTYSEEVDLMLPSGGEEQPVVLLGQAGGGIRLPLIVL
ncbi:hypothetical protein KLP28_03140 [Nocardioidaceae bacterium]|nr:hypothetical protein KLP28_03140 [Nocardioidaceae bacterium]